MNWESRYNSLLSVRVFARLCHVSQLHNRQEIRVSKTTPPTSSAGNERGWSGEAMLSLLLVGTYPVAAEVAV